MKARWSAPILAAGITALALVAQVHGGYFGTTNYSGNTPPTSFAQTHFIAACEDAGIQTVDYSPPGETPNTGKTISVEEERSLDPALLDAGIQQALDMQRTPRTGAPMRRMAREIVLHPVYETVQKPVTETILRPVCVTVMKEEKTIIRERVWETEYKEYEVKSRKRICEQVVENQCYQIEKPVCETIYQERSHRVRKPVTETHYRECQQTVCTPVTENVLRETKRIVYQEVTETVYQCVNKTVEETVTCNRLVTKVVPETVCEKVFVHGHFEWKEVPKFECDFDPCTCSTVQKQVGTRRKLIHEPGHTVTREVTRNKCVVEQVPETRVVHKVVTEKVPVTVTKKVPVTVCEKVPVTETRKVPKTQVVKVPYTVTKMVSTIEVERVPVTVHCNLKGAYVDVASLTDGAAQAAQGVEYIQGGPGALRRVDAPIYECNAPGRVFVAGLCGSKPVTHYKTRTVVVTDIRRVPYRVAKIVPHEVVKQVPVTTTRMVPTPITRMVPVTTCRLVTEEVMKPVPVCLGKTCPEVVNGCQPGCQSGARPCQDQAARAKLLAEKAHSRISRPAGTSCGTNCGAGSMNESECGLPCGPRVRGCSSPSGSCGSSCGTCTSNNWFHKLFNNPCRQHPIRDFFNRVWENHVTCHLCKKTPCGSCVPNTAQEPVTQPQKAPPPSPPATLPTYMND